jgi:hypothetical protein
LERDHVCKLLRGQSLFRNHSKDKFHELDICADSFLNDEKTEPVPQERRANFT